MVYCECKIHHTVHYFVKQDKYFFLIIEKYHGKPEANFHSVSFKIIALQHIIAH